MGIWVLDPEEDVVAKTAMAVQTEGVRLRGRMVGGGSDAEDPQLKKNNGRRRMRERRSTTSRRKRGREWAL